MIHETSDKYPWQVFWPTGEPAGRYANREAARLKAYILSGVYRFMPRGET